MNSALKNFTLLTGSRAGKLLLIWGAAMLVMAPAAFAAEAAAGDPMMNLVYKTINFVVLLAILIYFGRKPVANLLRGAAEKTRTELETAREAARSAEAQLAEQKSKIDNLEAELERLRQEARHEAQTESERVIAEAQAQGEHIKAQIQLQVVQEFSKARTELKRQLADRTIQLAETQIEAQLDPKRREELAQTAIQHMGDRQ